MRNIIIITMLLVLWMTAHGRAAEFPSFMLEEIIVSADADRTAFSTDNVNVKIISPGEASTVPDLLRQIAGIGVQQRGLTDNQDSTVILRGFDARRFTVLVDGRPVNMSGVMGGNYVDWNAIPLNMVEKIQLIKGAKAAAYGNTEGGVINIITKAHPDTGGEITLMTSQQGRHQYLFNYGGMAKRLGWGIYANKTGEDAFLRNNDYDSEQIGFKLRYDFTADDALKININHAKQRRGFIIQNQPGGATGYDPAYPVIAANNADTLLGNVRTYPGGYSQLFSNNWDAAWTHKTPNGYITLSYWKNSQKRREVNTFPALDRMIVADISNGWQLTGETKINKNKVSYGVDYKRLRYGYGWYDAGNGMPLFPSQKIDLLGIYIDDTWPINNRWTGNIGLRYDKFAGRPDADPAQNSADASAISPKLNFSFRNNRTMTTFISVNALWRAPSMAEFYWWSANYDSHGAAVGAQRQLKPEKGLEYEIGFEKQVAANYSTKVSGYYQHIDDYINFTHQWPFSCYNLSGAKLWGFEWENTYRFNDASRLIMNYTNQHTRKEGVNSADKLGLPGELDYRPRHKITLGYHYDGYPWQFRYNICYTGAQKANFPLGTAKIVIIGGYVIHSLSLVNNMGDGRSLTVAVDNIFNKYYVEQYNYQMPGRLLSVTLNQKL